MGTITLITGGARSGKSAWALAEAERCGLGPRIFVATAELIDEEMRERARRHRQERGDSWRTLEEPYNLAAVVRDLPADAVSVVDCLTVWLGNIWHHRGDSDTVLGEEVAKLAAELEQWRLRSAGRILLITNEVGWGIVPVEPAVRRYRDWAGRMNQRAAQLADEVYLSIAGYVLQVKKLNA